VEDKIRATGDNPARGDRVKVYYDPLAPEKAMVGGTDRMSGIQYLVEWLAGMALFVLAVILAVRAGRIQRKERANVKEPA
jgi:hypothetical protein